MLAFIAEAAVGLSLTVAFVGGHWGALHTGAQYWHRSSGIENQETT